MRVVDLDHDMSDVIPTGTSPDSEFLFRRMEEVTFASLHAGPGALVLDSAAGIGQDDRQLADEGVRVVGAEPSKRMTALAVLKDAENGSRPSGSVLRVRAWSEALPFRREAFDAAFCKGALDHFDDPLRCVEEMAHVTRPDGRVVLAVANFGSLSCRAGQLRGRWARASGSEGRRHFDVPSDHFTRYDARLLREQAQRHIDIDEWTGVSLFWGMRGWAWLLGRLPLRWAERLLRLADAVARRLPALADVIVAAGTPLRR
jgi:SAM-dependent methyltransferase